MWVAIAGAVLYFTDLPRRVLESDDVDRFLSTLTARGLMMELDRLALNIAIVCLAINTVLMLYLTVYIPYLERYISYHLSAHRSTHSPGGLTHRVLQ